MTDDLRWAVRYAFLEDLWRDRPRVIVDAGLEAALLGGGAASDEPLAELVDALVPAVPRARTWMAVADESVARQLAQTRPGTGFLPRATFAEVVAHRDWAVALVEMSALEPDAPGARRLAEQLAQRAAEGRTVLISARAQADEEGDAGFAALAELLDESLGGGRIYGVYRPPMAALVDFGEGEGEDDEVPLSFDNTLGTQAPDFVEYVAVAGETPSLPEGMTLVELPPDVALVSSGGDESLRDRLLQAQRQAELAAIDRQALLEKVDELESERQRLEQQAGNLRDELARAVTEHAPEDPGANEQLQAALADNQALRWTVQQLEREQEALRARPVEALEAEVAALRAELEALQSSPAQADAVERTADGAVPASTEPDTTISDAADERVEPAAGPTSADSSETDVVAGVIEVDEPSDAEPFDMAQIAVREGDYASLEVLEDEAVDRAERLRFGGALAQLDRLIAQVERGGIGVLPLRDALVSIRRRLRS